MSHTDAIGFTMAMFVAIIGHAIIMANAIMRLKD